MDNSNFSVLIVDDEPDLLEVMEFQIEELGYNTFKAKNGTEALETLNNHKIDVVISDVQMPNGGGLALIINAKNKFGKKTIFIFVSGLLDSNKKDVMEAGAFEYLEKPTSFDELKATLEKAISTLN